MFDKLAELEIITSDMIQKYRKHVENLEQNYDDVD